MTQLEIHKKIDEFFKAGVKSDSVEVAKEILNSGSVLDTRNYFFSRADENWLDWLWEKDFLATLKEKADDPTRYSYRMPELEYLTRMTEKKPEKVAKIIKTTPISESNFNPEVIDRFLWILGSLSVEQIKTLTKNIRDDRWAYLMRDFNKSCFDFKKIVEVLVEKKEFDGLIELAGAILDTKTKEELEKKDKYLSVDNPFYLHDINYSGIFEALIDIDESHTEKALKVIIGVMEKIVKLADKDENNVFDFSDSYALYDVDFFTLELDGKRSDSYREDVKNLAAVIKKLVEKTIGTKCGDSIEAKRLFTGYIDDLPKSRAMWRLRLFVLAQCPEVFKEELKNAFLQIFNVGERYFEIEGGAEYHQVLIRGFGVLDGDSQREYVRKVFEYFNADIGDEDKEKWRRRDGIQILHLIRGHLTPDEKKIAKDKFGISPDEAKSAPEPTIGKMRGGMIRHQSPITLDDYTIDQIIDNLKSEWTPEKLSEQFKGDDFLSPRGAEGLGDALKENFKKRMDEYFPRLPEFFDRDYIDPSYLYSILRGIEESFREKNNFNKNQIDQILDLLKSVRLSGEDNKFQREDRKNEREWLSDWITAHQVLTDVLLHIVENKENRKATHQRHRDEIKYLIDYLFTIKESPSNEDEDPKYGDLFQIAINSVRGRAFQVFIVFIENDGKTLSKDTKELYKKLLDEGDSLVVRFMIGHYLASFYFRDEKFITQLFPKIFPKDDPKKKGIYLATWEGYLANTLYDKLLIALDDYYKHAISLNPKEYTKRKYLKGLDETLAIHIALAYIHLGLNIDDPLLDLFWKTKNTVRHQEFISFIGKHCITRDQAGDEWLKDNKVSKDKLLKFWDWVLENSTFTELESLSGFGYWVNQDKEILDDKILVKKMAEILEKSGGNISYDYGLLKRLSFFANIDRDNTFRIIRFYLLDKDENLNQNRRIPFMHDGQVKNALEIIYKEGNKEDKQKITDLINTLIEKGSSIFWELKSIIT